MFFKNFMKWMILLTIMVTLSSSYWFIYWLMMEMNLLMFLPIMNSKKKNNANCLVTYFVIQAFSSTLFFFSSVCFSMLNLFFFEFMIMISIMIKLAVIPFHFWLTSLSELINYSSLFMILTLQKIIPLFILMMNKLEMMVLFALISSIFGSLLLFNLKSLKKILIFSSISHQGWLMILLAMNSNFWLSYMFIYSLLIYKISKIFEKNNFLLTNSFFKKKNSINEKISIATLMLSLGGMPPFTGFMMKFISILIIVNNSIYVVMILILSSIINIFIYLRMINVNLFLNLIFLSKKTFYNYYKKSALLYMNLFISIFILNIVMF
uniref:NADH dehydrogenase subunit 2 n=1 Tax=Amblyomma breviscutatum TaxID=3134081 RepID=UPI0030FEF0E9